MNPEKIIESLSQKIGRKIPQTTFYDADDDYGYPYYIIKDNRIHTLSLAKCNFMDIADLELPDDLVVLSLNQNSINDISPLVRYPSIEELYLSRNNIEDVSPLLGLNKLRLLDLGCVLRTNPLKAKKTHGMWGGNPVKNIDVLSKLSSLRSLYLEDCHLTDTLQLANITQLENLSLCRNPITSLEGLEGLANLKRLNATGMPTITDVSQLASLTRLKRLRLHHNSITDISPLSSLKELEMLVLGGNSIKDIQSLSNLSSLQFLNLGDNNISDISSLSNCKGLRDLFIDNNSISDISPLASLAKLERLYIDKNQISDVSSLKGLKSLKQLYVDENRIVDISSLSGLLSLKELHMCSNRIENIEALGNIKSLQNADFSNNNITTMPKIIRLQPKRVLSLDWLHYHLSLLIGEICWKVQMNTKLSWEKTEQFRLKLYLKMCFSNKKYQLITGDSKSFGYLKIMFPKAIVLDGNPVLEENVSE